MFWFCFNIQSSVLHESKHLTKSFIPHFVATAKCTNNIILCFLASACHFITFKIQALHKHKAEYYVYPKSLFFSDNGETQKLWTIWSVKDWNDRINNGLEILRPSPLWKIVLSKKDFNWSTKVMWGWIWNTVNFRPQAKCISSHLDKLREYDDYGNKTVSQDGPVRKIFPITFPFSKCRYWTCIKFLKRICECKGCLKNY